MATITNAIAQINTTVPPGQRVLTLNETHFDGTVAGEGTFLQGYGEDRIPVRDLLKYPGRRVEITFTEGTGGAGDSYTLLIRLNPWQTIYNYTDTQPHDGDNPYQFSRPDLSAATEIDTNILAISITASVGETVTWTQDLPIYDIGINADTPGGSGTLGDLSIIVY